MEESTPAREPSRGGHDRATGVTPRRGRRPAVIGLDVGTSAVKGLLAAETGALATARRGYRLELGADGRVELDAETVSRAVRSVIRSLAGSAEQRGHRVVAVCSGGSGDEAVWLDERDRAVGPIPMALDRRSEPDGRALVDAIGLDRFVKTTGLPPSGAYSLPRLAWLMRTAPDIAARVRRLLAWPEFVALRLGAEPVAEPTLAARSAAYDVRHGRWHRPLIEAARVDPAVFPALAPTGAVVGRMSAAVAKTLGLDGAVEVVAGGFDQAMATRGAGIDAAGIAHLGTGSWEAVTVLANTPAADLARGRISRGPSIDAHGAWSLMWSGPGGAALGWLEGIGRIRSMPGRQSVAVRRALATAATAPDLPTGVFVSAKRPGSADGAGVLAGLRLDVDAATLARAVLEGVAFDAADALDEIAAAGSSVRAIYITGGTAADPRWIQLRADVIGLPVVAVEPRDAGVCTAAALAWAAVVGDRSVAAMLERLVRHDPPIDPRYDHQQRYADLRQGRAALKLALATLSDEAPTIGR